MMQGERIIISLNPNFNPTGKPAPDTILKQMKADPDFAKLSDDARKKVIDKVNSMISEMADIKKYGTLRDKVDEATKWGHGQRRYKDRIYVITKLLYFSDSNNYSELETSVLYDGTYNGCNYDYYAKHFQEGVKVKGGQTIAFLCVSEDEYTKGEFGSDSLSFSNDEKIAEIKSPIAGSVYSLTEIREYGEEVSWGEDLFIVSSIPNDTRQNAIKWYKETTGKDPSFITPEDKAEVEANASANADNFLSKWGF